MDPVNPEFTSSSWASGSLRSKARPILGKSAPTSDRVRQMTHGIDARYVDRSELGKKIQITGQYPGTGQLVRDMTERCADGFGAKTSKVGTYTLKSQVNMGSEIAADAMEHTTPGFG